MKIKKIYESGNVHFNANLLSKKMSKNFFGHIDEFERIVVKEEDESFCFYICFSEVYKETIEALGDFNEFIGRIKRDQWGILLDKFDFDDSYYMYDLICINKDDIDKYLQKIEMLENANNYNL